MVPGPRPEGMRAPRTAHAALRTGDDLRAGIVRLIGLHARADITLARGPGALELRATALRIVAGEKCRILRDARRDEMVRNLLDDRAALLAIEIGRASCRGR